jgi:GDP-L-fucose synthase
MDMNKNSKIYIAGHTGMVGSAILRRLKKEGYTNIIYKSSKDLDLRNQKEVSDFFQNSSIEYVFLCAAKVGGINANNSMRADFIYDNIMIQSNIIKSSFDNNIKKLLFLGSSCIYPKSPPQPIKEEYLLSSYLESTNEPYAIAKIAGIKMCESFNNQYGTNYISVMPTNLYGPNDNYDYKTSHVFPAILRKIHDAKVNKSKSIELWGSGEPYREFLFVDDLVDACLFLMNNYNQNEIINIGTGVDLKIKDLAKLMMKTIGYECDLLLNSKMPDGTPRKLLDVSKINRLGWHSTTDLELGIKLTYQDFVENYQIYSKI